MIKRHFLGLPSGSCLIARCSCYEEKKTYNNHDALIRHIERRHKSNPEEVKIRAKVPENNRSTYNEDSDGPHRVSTQCSAYTESDYETDRPTDHIRNANTTSRTR